VFYRGLQATLPRIAVNVDFNVGGGGAADGAAATFAAQASSGSPTFLNALTAQLQLAFNDPTVFAYASASPTAAPAPATVGLTAAAALGMAVGAFACVLLAAFGVARLYSRRKRAPAISGTMPPTGYPGGVVLHLREKRANIEATESGFGERRSPARSIATPIKQLSIYADLDEAIFDG
jgi:hypothetical protein